jgi:hypothetical protein
LRDDRWSDDDWNRARQIADGYYTGHDYYVFAANRGVGERHWELINLWLKEEERRELEWYAQFYPDILEDK